MKYGLIGEHLPHSFSKEIHEMLAGYEYTLCELQQDELSDFLKRREFCGINVTIPYKERVIPFLDEISPEAAAIGAVNTIKNIDGRLFGYNTDFEGMRELFQKNGISPEGKKAAILGSGGTSKTAKALLQSFGATEILTVSRTKKDGGISFEELYRDHHDVEILVNTTPVGMFPNNDSCPVSLSNLPSLVGVIDAVYNPLLTRLVMEAKERKIPAAGGLYMLIMQAARAAEIFLDKIFPEKTVKDVYQRVLQRKRNIVLTGMPGAGKTTVGNLLSNQLSMDFFDTDAEIVRNSGMTVEEIFSSCGEEEFRRLEREVIAKLSKKQGCIIATGGGAILSEKNIENVRQNGKIYFLDRALEELIPTSDRPTARSKEDLKKRYCERYSIYLETADCRIFGMEDPMHAAEMIKKDFLKT